MPARSNDFQRLVFLVKKVLAGTNATVTESKFLKDLQTGDDREVDVVIEAELGGHPVTLCIECIDHTRPASVTWVEQMHSKHQRLPTGTLVLASRSGFSRKARSLAKVAGLELLTYTGARLAKEITNLTQAIALGGNIPAVVQLLKERDKRLKALDAILAKPPALPAREKLRAALEQRVEDWREVLRSNTPQARMVLQQLVGPITMPETTERPRWLAQPQPAGLLVGMVHGVASPTGFEPVFWP